MNLTTSDADTNPGRPAAAKGPTWAAGLHDHLKLPNGSTVGQTDNETLRAEFARLGIEGAHSLGRDVLCRRYSEMLTKIGMDAYNAAVTAFLQRPAKT